MSEADSNQVAVPTKARSGPTPGELKELEKECQGHALAHSCSELLFTLLPFVVLVLVFLKSRPHFEDLFGEAEWSFAAVILFGQSAVRIVMSSGSAANDGYPVRAENVGFIVSFLMVLGVVPSMAVMVMIMLLPPPPQWLICLQGTLFVLAVLVFLFLGTAAKMQELMRREEWRRGWLPRM